MCGPGPWVGVGGSSSSGLKCGQLGQKRLDDPSFCPWRWLAWVPRFSSYCLDPLSFHITLLSASSGLASWLPKCRNRSYKASGGPSRKFRLHYLHCIPWSEKVRASPDSKEERRNVSSEMEKSHCRRAYRMGQIAVTILGNNLPHGQMEKGHEPMCSLRLLLVLSSSESEVQTISLAKWQINPRWIRRELSQQAINTRLLL